MTLCSMHVSACIKQSNFHLWMKRSAFSSSKHHLLDKEYFACLKHVSELMKNLLMHISVRFICVVRHIIPSFWVASPYDLHEESSPSVNFPSLLRSVLWLHRPTASKPTSLVMTTRRRLRCVCVGLQCSFLLNMLVKWMFNVSHVLSFTQTHYSLTLRTTLMWGHRYWDPETSLRRFDGLVRVYFELVRAENPTKPAKTSKPPQAGLSHFNRNIHQLSQSLSSPCVCFCFWFFYYQKRLWCGFRSWKLFLFSSFSSIVS